jgi:DNA-binding response OmpR family regulator
MGVRAKILLIEGKGKNVRSFRRELGDKGFQVAVVHSGRKAREVLISFRPDVVIMDASNYPSSGVRICKNIRMTTTRIPLIYIGAAGKPRPSSIRAHISLSHPFTIRKLVNRINQCLPSSDGQTLQAGPLILYVDKRSLHKDQREHRLTPKQAQLLEVLMRHPGELIRRSELMRKVWETDFLDDTRTLDVHIRWVREAVEDNPSKPRFITTVRGKGYKFAIPGQAPRQA